MSSKEIDGLIAQLFRKQHTNNEKDDRRRTTRQQEQHDQKRESTSIDHADTHTTGVLMAQHQPRYGDPSAPQKVSGIILSNRPQANSPRQNLNVCAEPRVKKDQIDAAKLCADGRAHYVVGALKPLRSNATQNLPTNLQSSHPLGPTHRTRQGQNVYDFPGSDDETELHEHKASPIRLNQSLHDVSSDGPQKIIKLRFTQNSLLYRKCTAAFAEAPAPTANKAGLITTSVAPSDGMAKRHAPFPCQISAGNGPPEAMSEHAHDSTEKHFRRKALKGMMNISGQYKALPKSQEVENKQQPTFDVNHALVVQIPAAKANDEWQTQGRTLSGQSDASRAPSELSVDNDDEGDETYTPGKASKAKQNGAKRPKIAFNKSKAAKKRRVGFKRRDDNQHSSYSAGTHTSQLHLSGETAPIATGLQAGPDSLDTPLARASAELENPERPRTSPAHTQPEASVWETRSHTADLKKEEQESTWDLLTAPSTQAQDGEKKGGDDPMHTDVVFDVEKSNDPYEDGSHGKPIFIPDENLPPVEYRPIYPPPTPWQSDIAAAIKAFEGMAGIEQPLSPVDQNRSTKIEGGAKGFTLSFDREYAGSNMRLRCLIHICTSRDSRD